MSAPVEDLINEIRLCYHSLVQIGDEIHSGSTISLGMRAVLEFLSRNGDTTVPDIARSRRVTRQRIQSLVNALLDESLVQTIANPASKRSPLITLTPTGKKRISDMRKLEGNRMRTSLSDKRVTDATKTLAQLRTALEGVHS